MRFVPNPAFEAELARSPSMGRFCATLASAVAAAAEVKAPRRLGYLEGGIEGTAELEDGRYIGRVWSHDWKTLLIEHGTRRMRARPFLIPAVIETLPGATLTRDR